MPELAAHARRYLRAAGWLGGADTQPRGFEVEELIAEAVKRVLSGERNWHRDDPPNLVAFLSKVMWSICGHERAKLARERPDPEQVAMAARAAEPDADGGYDHPLLAKLDQVIADDEDLQYFVMAAEDAGPKREDIAKALDWTPEKVSVIRKKLLRRLQRSTSPVATRRQDE